MPRKLLAACLLAVAAPLAAQSTGTPVFHAPYRPFERYEIGANVSDAGNIAIEGFYGFSHAGARWDFGLRAGILDYSGNSNAAVLIGVDARYRVIDQTDHAGGDNPYYQPAKGAPEGAASPFHQPAKG